MLRSWLATWGSPSRGSSRSPDSYVADPNVKVLPYNPIRKSALAANRPISMSRTKTWSLIQPTIFLPTQAPSRVAGVSAAP
jgi:hypothetical protein